MSDTNSQPIGRMSIYSGRPDPQWTMSNDDWNELHQLLETLTGKTEHEGIFNEPSLLGYRGFVGDWKEEQIYYVAQTNQAVKVNKSSYIIYDDPSKFVETWFVKNAKTNGDLDLSIRHY